MKHEPWVYGNWAGIIGVLITIPVVVARHIGLLGPKWNYYHLACLVAWALGPPLWFGWERRWHTNRGAKDDRLKELESNQKVAQAIWAGIYAFISVLYLKTAIALQ